MTSRPKKITLVLGAGASVAMGYPVGAGLRQKLLDLASPTCPTFMLSAGIFDREGECLRFLESFRRSQMLSVDAFLARRPEFSEIGKRCIAALLLDVENEETLFNTKHADHWYRYFFNKFSSESWGNLNFSNISIVTFNYDRSLEKYLHEVIKSSYGKSDDEIAEKLETLKIVHVYGSLGSAWPWKDGFLSYGGGATADRVMDAEASLRVIPEGRDDDETLQSARAMLSEADRIAFMGFGFDQANVARLHAETTCKRKQKNAETVLKTRQIVATCMGFTNAEAMKAFRLIGQELDSYHVPGSDPPGFHSCNCLGLLRETLILD